MLGSWKTRCWDVISSYFKERGIVQQHLDSFDEFLPDIIGRLIEELPPIEVRDINQTRHIFQFQGMENVFIPRPQYTECDSQVTNVYPSMARMRNFTYATSIFCKILWKKNQAGKAEFTDVDESRKLRFIGRVPVMVRSSCCSLRNMSDEELYKINECPSDPGGYFVVNGKERVIIAQERAANNTVFVFPSHIPDSKILMECEIRSTVEKSSASAHALWVHLCAPRSPRRNPKKDKWKRNEPRLKVRLPSLSKTVDVTVFFQALGFDNDREIYQNIVEMEDPGECKTHLLKQLLERSLRTHRYKNQEEAKRSLGELAIKPDLDEDERRLFVEHLLNREFLPHIGVEEKDMKKKGYFLCHMIRRLLETFASYRLCDDRDHLQNKRYFFAGPLMAQMFYRTLRNMHSELKKSIERQVQQRRPINLDAAINPSIISKGMAFSLATGNWGDLRKATTRIYKGVTQELNRLTYAALISSLRRVNSPEDKLHLMVKPRQIHNTYFGMICPCETPEGKAVGLVKNLAMEAIITVGSNPRPLHAYLLLECGVRDMMETIERYELEKQSLARLTKVFLNGLWIGFHENPTSLIGHLRQMRRIGGTAVTDETSISWDTSTKSIEIRTDAGRICRPLMIVEKNELLITEEHFDRLRRDSNFGWRELLHEGVVEMIDARESEDVLIAMYPQQLKENGYKSYTHMEIHPSLILGICAAIIPFCEHNQSPRNVYQSAIAKQAMGVYATNFHTRVDTSAHVLYYGQKPLIKTKLMEYSRFDRLPAGINCVVAIASYEGYNQEDSLILNRAALDRGLFRSTYYHTYTDKAERNIGRGDQDETFCIPDKATTRGLRLVTGEEEAMVRYGHLEEDGLPAPGEQLKEDDAIIGKTMNIPTLEMNEILAIKARYDDQARREKEIQAKKGIENKRKPRAFNVLSRVDKSTYLKKPSSGIVDSVMVTWNAEGLRLVKVRVRTMLIPQVGDKFASLHGQKGVTGMIYREEDMPFTKQGIIPDIIINPHGIPSRMTIGQLIESVTGKAAAISGKVGDGTPFEPMDRKDWLEKAGKVLVKHGFHATGYEVLYVGPTGRKMSAMIFMGPTYYQRLRHLVDDKIHSRARGAVNVLTRQPVQGFSRDGGLRFGEMERDCVISHGTMLFLSERMLDVSDVYYFAVCNRCGMIVSQRPCHSPKKPAFVCHRCSPIENKYGACTLKVPYAAKLFIQELMCMNIALRINAREVTVENGVDVINIPTHDDLNDRICLMPTPPSSPEGSLAGSNVGSMDDLTSLGDSGCLTDVDTEAEETADENEAEEEEEIDIDDFKDSTGNPEHRPVPTSGDLGME